MCVCVHMHACVHVFVLCVCTPKRGPQFLELSFRHGVTSHCTWMLGTKLGLFRRPTSALHCWAISLVLFIYFSWPSESQRIDYRILGKGLSTRAWDPCRWPHHQSKRLSLTLATSRSSGGGQPCEHLPASYHYLPGGPGEGTMTGYWQTQSCAGLRQASTAVGPGVQWWCRVLKTVFRFISLFLLTRTFFLSHLLW